MFSVITKWLPKPIRIKKGVAKKLQDVFGECQLLYNLVYGFLSEATPTIKSKVLDNSELTDFGYLCRELENLFDELRKEAKARKELCGAIIAYRLIKESLTDPTITMRSKGTLATGTPDIKMQAALPKKFSEEYFQLTTFFGVPRDVAETGILRLDWKKVTEYCTKLTEDGKPIPEGFGKKYPLYSTVYRKTKGG